MYKNTREAGMYHMVLMGNQKIPEKEVYLQCQILYCAFEENYDLINQLSLHLNQS